MNALNDSLFLRALRCEPLPRPPVWMMRQAGRYLPEYRKVREGISFTQLCRSPDLASEVTLQPIRRFGVDAAVIFSDILVVLEALGLEVTFEKGEGPMLPQPLRCVEDLARLRPAESVDELSYVAEAIQRVVGNAGVPVLGFTGSPFTLAAYAIEGQSSRDFVTTRRFMREQPEGFARLLELLSQAIARHACNQIKAGASAIQIFETWGGLLGPSDFREIALPPNRHAIHQIQSSTAPVILYLNGTAPHIEAMADSGAQALSIDWRVPLSEARRRAGHAVALQGNLDPTRLFGAAEQVAAATRQMLQDYSGPGLVANLGHGILPQTPVENAAAFIETVKNWT